MTAAIALDAAPLAGIADEADALHSITEGAIDTARRVRGALHAVHGPTRHAEGRLTDACVGIERALADLEEALRKIERAEVDLAAAAEDML